MMSLGLDAAVHFGLDEPAIRWAMSGYFRRWSRALDLAPAWKRRLIKDFNHQSTRLLRTSTGLPSVRRKHRLNIKAFLTHSPGRTPKQRMRW